MKILTWLGKVLGVVPHGAGVVKEPEPTYVERLRPPTVVSLIELRVQRKRDKESGINAS